MSERIGAIRFFAFADLSPIKLAALDRHQRRLRAPEPALSLADSHPTQPPMRPYAPELDRTADLPVFKLAAELSPMMAAFHERAHDLAVLRDILKRWHERQVILEGDQERHVRHLDDLHRYMTELLFQRVYERTGRMSSIFLKIKKLSWLTTARFARIHRQTRLEEAELFPRLFIKALRSPFVQEVKEPNQFKLLDFERMRIAAWREHREKEVLSLHELRRWQLENHVVSLYDKKQTTSLHIKLKTGLGTRDKRFRAMDDYAEAWRHTSDTTHFFRDAVRHSIIAQSELFPELFRKALMDAFETEIKVPNDHTYLERVQQKIDFIRGWQHAHNDHRLELLRLAREQEVQDYGQHRKELDGSIEQRDKRHTFENLRSVNAAVASAKGMEYVAGRATPRVLHTINSDIKATRPLPLGIQGNPQTLEATAPVPPQNDAFYDATAGMRVLGGKGFEQPPPALKDEEVHKRIERRMQLLLGASGYAAQRFQSLEDEAQKPLASPTQKAEARIAKQAKLRKA